MKSILKICLLLFGVLVSLTACDDNEFSLGGKLDPSELEFTVVQDYTVDVGGNTVILTNSTPETIPLWDYGTGKSSRAVDTIRFAFAGNYTIKFSAITDGGVVEAEPITITVTQDNLNYVNDPLWTNLSGGVGNEKSWVFDNGQYGIGYGALSYADPNTTVEWNNFTPNWEPGGNPPGSTDADMHWGRYMTFSLDGGPFMTIHENDGTVIENGTYFLDINAHTLTTTGTTILRPDNYIANVSNWTNNIKVLTLTENRLQIAVMRTNSEGPWWLIWNFVSKEYADNYVPVITDPVFDEGFNPTFAPGELLTMLTGGAGAGRIWKLDGSGNPVDWLAAGVGWTTGASSSYNWGWNDDWTAIATSSWIRFDQWNGQLGYTRNQNGVITSGTFTINEETNEINLGTETLLQNSTSWMNPTTNVIKVVKAFNEDFLVKGIWFGTSYNATNDEWFVFHYIVP